MKPKPKHNRKCRPDTKSAGAACVKMLATIEMPIHRNIQDDMTKVRDFLLKRWKQQQMKVSQEAEEAGEEVLKEIKRQMALEEEQ
jgi:hypothetical protein